jgi:hypothetical protein
MDKTLGLFMVFVSQTVIREVGLRQELSGSGAAARYLRPYAERRVVIVAMNAGLGAADRGAAGDEGGPIGPAE